MKVLHLHSDLQWGGVEQWLLQLSRHIDRSSFQMEFFSASATPQWQQTIRSLGLRLVPSPRPRQMWSYISSLRDTLKARAYDAIHCHFADHGGLLLREAARAGVPLRIAHSHQDTTHLLAAANVLARTYIGTQNRLLRKHATRGLAASSEAAHSMFGAAWKTDPRWEVVHCGLDLEPFSKVVGRKQVRARIGVRDHEFVFGHVGRFMAQKNHEFLIELIPHLARTMDQARFLWIGDGPLRAAFENRLAQQGLRDRVILIPQSDAVAELMVGAMDAFLFPSLFEGLGLALVEAQAAGLPCFVADTVPEESTVVASLVTRLSLQQGPLYWADAIQRALDKPISIEPEMALETVRQSGFNIHLSTKRIEELYRGDR